MLVSAVLVVFLLAHVMWNIDLHHRFTRLEAKNFETEKRVERIEILMCLPMNQIRREASNPEHNKNRFDLT